LSIGIRLLKLPAMSRLILPDFETSILWRYFDGVSSAVAKRMLRGSAPNEENLTFLLCELLDEDAAGLHNLEYSLDQVKRELENSDAGIKIDIGFETHEHSKHFESKYSGADIGIVFSLDHPLLGKEKRAVLLQAKRLFAPRKQDKFSLYSEYSNFDVKQALFLRQLQRKFEVHNSILYLWYNPPSTGFLEEHAKYIKAFEATTEMSYQKRHLSYERFMYNGLGFLAPSNLESNTENVHKEWRSTQPALRLTNLRDLEEDTRVIALKPLYDKAKDDPTSFLPFASFFLMAMSGVRWGSPKDEWIALAQGGKIKFESLKGEGQKGDEPNLIESLQFAPIPKHTLTFSISSTLPQIG
jgi:hypothetical protein